MLLKKLQYYEQAFEVKKQYIGDNPLAILTFENIFAQYKLQIKMLDDVLQQIES
ncbi:hypothetical protein [Ectobacillus polymachus]|uniref:hypothetical protein n=1 Tax=Ectobacillus polymachus TaxID=1508806 RepID=UPI003A858C09